MSYTINLENLNLGIDRIVIPFLATYNLKPIEDRIPSIEDTNEEYFLRAILLIKRILEEEITYLFSRFFKELLIIATLDEIRNNYIDYYNENKGT